MDHRPIGVFDSRSGRADRRAGADAAAAAGGYHLLRRYRPVPYGVRSPETILKFARQDMNFLCSYDLKAVVIACGTVSTTSLSTLRREYHLPIIGVVEPTAAQAARVTRSGRIGLIATAASIRSGAYEKRIAARRPGATVYGKACPLFVPLVENGRFQMGDPVIETIAREYLQSMQEADVDTLILGCTHYPLLSDVIRHIMGPDVTLINSGREAARHCRPCSSAATA